MKTIAIAPRIEYMDHAWKYFCNEAYIKKIQEFNWYPILLLSNNTISSLVDNADALLLPGGYDLASCYFHQPMDPHAILYQRPMDHFDFILLDAFVKAKKPILGICRGMQIINVYFNGNLHQHIDTSLHEQEPHQHMIHPLPHTPCEQLFLSDTLINSYHHQCVDVLGDGLFPSARSLDKHIEAIYHETLPIFAVQWHPELMEHDCIFPYFFDVLTRI